MKRVLLGMSGGVDSTAAVIRLKNLGYEVVGITFIFTENFDTEPAVKAAASLGIEHHIADYKKEFKEKIIDQFIEDYKNGLTPNPCVLCNRICKFYYLFENMEKYNCDFVATGHYAKLEEGRLYRSHDLNKDQSYFLSRVPKEKLQKILFPLEGLVKEEVRELAKDYKLENHNQKDSYDVCFITDSFREYMKTQVKNIPGDVVNVETKEVIGKHNGLSLYTIGQRRGLNIGGFEDKMYVVGKDLNKNILYISLGEDNDYLMSTSCIVDEVNWLGTEKIKNCTAKFRYRSEDKPVELEWLEDDKVLVKYPEGRKSVTPGQTCTFYLGDECIGGGTIREVEKNGEKCWYL